MTYPPPHNPLEARTTRRFVQVFRAQHATLCAALHGLPPDTRESFVARLLHSLTVLYFLQQRGLLDGSPRYLRERMRQLRQQHGADQFFPFFCRLLLHLFHPEHRQTEREALVLLGQVPQFVSRLFTAEELLHASHSATVADAAFTQVLDSFDGFNWVLEASHPPAANSITPDILGYVFEQYINRKQMGAYYTEQDVTTYIAASTIIPALFDTFARRLPVAAPPWQHLRNNPNRYIHADMRHGIELPLPPHIASGLHDPAARAAWNQPADPAFGLPNEIWREHIARRKRVIALLDQIRSGQLCTIDDLITANLDLQQIALDWITESDASLLQAVYHSLHDITVLDPTCGSGAFLVAALAVLEPLYAACLTRMEQLPQFGDTHAHYGYGWQRTVRIRTQIVCRNLYGVDIMAEAVEICNLRLLLNIIAPAHTLAPSGSPLNPGVNLRSGNALVGYADGESVGESSEQLTHRLANAYHIPTHEWATWLATQQPFHWSAAFPDILQRGGFDVIIGNPPYLTQKRDQLAFAYGVDGGKLVAPVGLSYRTAACGNLYALVVERSLNLLRPHGRLGMIVPIASVSTEGMRALQSLYVQQQQWHSHFAVRPGKLFVGVDMNLTISLICKTNQRGAGYTTGYRRWSGGATGDRRCLFTTLIYTTNPGFVQHRNPFPKLSSTLETQILQRLLAHGQTLSSYVTATGETLYYHSGGRYWRKALPVRLSSHYKPLTVAPHLAPIVFCLLNSQLFYWYWISNSNCMDVVAREVLNLPVFPLEHIDSTPFALLQTQLLAVYRAASSKRQRNGQRIHVEEINVDMARAKPLIDQIDRLLAMHYGFDAEELDFILHYDIKYRV